MITTLTLKAQQKKTYDRCGTDAFLLQSLKKYPGYRNTLQKANDQLNLELQKRLERARDTRNPDARTAAIVTIPVVVHIVLSDPSNVTDEEVQLQLDILNRDFSGFNADSSNLFPMYPYSLRGHSTIRFCLAQQDPQGNATNGMERRCSGTMANMKDEDPIKQTAKGGLDAWDPSRYLNIWVGSSSLSGLLGYATYPFSFDGYISPAPRFQGVVISRLAFGDLRTPYAFNRGRTLVHETGHFFGLFHPFEGGCADEDFTLYSVGSSINDDTPPQLKSSSSGNTSTTSCPTGNQPSGCSLSIDSGKLYQNFMDYTDDPCLTMFTVNQVARMEAALDLFLPYLKNASTCGAPTLITFDASASEMLWPFGGRNGNYLGCESDGSSNVYCTASLPYQTTPKIRIRNTGSAPLSRLEVYVQIDNQPATVNLTLHFNPGLPSLADTLISLNPVSFGAGAHTLKLFTKNPGGQLDGKPDNDTVTANLFIDIPSSDPIAEGFEGNTFPPAGWRILNTDADAITWEQTALAQQSGNSSAFINLYNDDVTGHRDYLLSPAIDRRNADSVLVSFDRAYREYSLGSHENSDTLELVISEDCGTTFKSVWKRAGAALATNPGPTGFLDWYPSSPDWKRVSIDVRPFLTDGAASLHVGFRAVNGFGQNLFLDNVNIHTYTGKRLDAAVPGIEAPSSMVCEDGFTPAIHLSNAGVDTLRSVELGYSIDGAAPVVQTWNGALGKGQSTMVSFTQVVMSTPGQHIFKSFTRSPNGQPDQNISNDSSLRVFNSVSTAAAPLHESFESNGVPPGWVVVAADASQTWQKTAEASSQGAASLVLRNRLYNRSGSTDDLYTPLVHVDRSDSVFVRFDLAYVPVKYPSNNGSVTDTLEVFFTADCGRTMLSLYRKWGGTLQTVPGSYVYPYSADDSTGFIPGSATLWRTDSIDLTPIAGAGGSFQLIFRNSNNNGNNLYLDNIRIDPLVLPARLKNKGYIIMPNPSAGWFYVRHYLRPVNLKAIQVVNASGQVVMVKRFNADALSAIPIDLSGQPSGIYVFRLLYTDKVVNERVIKISR